MAPEIGKLAAGDVCNVSLNKGLRNMLLEQDTERTSSSSAVTASTHTCQGDQSHVRRARRPTPWPQANLLSLGAATCADPAVSGTPALLSPEPRPTKDKSSILRSLKKMIFRRSCGAGDAYSSEPANQVHGGPSRGASLLDANTSQLLPAASRGAAAATSNSGGRSYRRPPAKCQSAAITTAVTCCRRRGGGTDSSSSQHGGGDNCDAAVAPSPIAIPQHETAAAAMPTPGSAAAASLSSLAGGGGIASGAAVNGGGGDGAGNGVGRKAGDGHNNRRNRSSRLHTLRILFNPSFRRAMSSDPHSSPMSASSPMPLGGGGGGASAYVSDADSSVGGGGGSVGGSAHRKHFAAAVAEETASSGALAAAGRSLCGIRHHPQQDSAFGGGHEARTCWAATSPPDAAAAVSIFSSTALEAAKAPPRTPTADTAGGGGALQHSQSANLASMPSPTTLKTHLERGGGTGGSCHAGTAFYSISQACSWQAAAALLQLGSGGLLSTQENRIAEDSPMHCWDVRGSPTAAVAPPVLPGVSSSGWLDRIVKPQQQQQQQQHGANQCSSSSSSSSSRSPQPPASTPPTAAVAMGPMPGAAEPPLPPPPPVLMDATAAAVATAALLPGAAAAITTARAAAITTTCSSSTGSPTDIWQQPHLGIAGPTPSAVSAAAASSRSSSRSSGGHAFHLLRLQLQAAHQMQQLEARRQQAPYELHLQEWHVEDMLEGLEAGEGGEVGGVPLPPSMSSAPAAACVGDEDVVPSPPSPPPPPAEWEVAALQRQQEAMAAQAAAAWRPPQPQHAVAPAAGAEAAAGHADVMHESAVLLGTNPALPCTMHRRCWALSDYAVTKRLYKGSLSSVYRATCKRSGIVVALKVFFRSRVSANALHVAKREVALHLPLVHPNIIMLYAAFYDANHLVLVQEYAPRGDLYGIHRRMGSRLTEKQVTELVLGPFLDALVYLHSRGVVHRDIKPENILYMEDWTPKLADFGVSINLAEERAVTRTGTKGYMAPEVLRCPLKHTHDENKDNEQLAYTSAVDIWSVGILAYELLVGFPPHLTTTTPLTPTPPDAAVAATGTAVVQQAGEQLQQQVASGSGNAAAGTHMTQAHPDPLSLPVSVSEVALDFIGSALAQAPGDRPTARQLLQHAWLARAVRVQGRARITQECIS